MHRFEQVRWVGAALTLAAGLGAARPSAAQDTALARAPATATARAAAPGPAVRPPEAIRAAQGVVLAAYPELWQQSLTMHITPAGSRYSVTVRDAFDLLTTGFVPPAPKVATLIELSPTHELVSFLAEGPLVRTAEGQAFAAEAAQHPEWSGAEVATRLLAAGARTSAALEAGLDLASWAKVIGTAPQRRAAPAPARGAIPTAPAAAVAVEATTNGRATSYQFQLDPFSGRVVAVTRQ